jgi:hypothetical protein
MSPCWRAVESGRSSKPRKGLTTVKLTQGAGPCVCRGTLIASHPSLPCHTRWRGRRPKCTPHPCSVCSQICSHVGVKAPGNNSIVEESVRIRRRGVATDSPLRRHNGVTSCDRSMCTLRIIAGCRSGPTAASGESCHRLKQKHLGRAARATSQRHTPPTGRAAMGRRQGH